MDWARIYARHPWTDEPSSTVLATAPWRKARRSMGGEHKFEPNPLPTVACSDAVQLDSNEFDIVPSVETLCSGFPSWLAASRSIHDGDFTLRNPDLNRDETPECVRLSAPKSNEIVLQLVSLFESPNRYAELG